MTSKPPSNDALQKKDGVIGQRQQQIDPAGHHRADPDDTKPERSQKQAGQDLSDPQEENDDAE